LQKSPQKRRYSAKKTYDFQEPTNRSHPIVTNYARQKYANSANYVRQMYAWLVTNYARQKYAKVAQEDINYLRTHCIFYKLILISDVPY